MTARVGSGERALEPLRKLARTAQGNVTATPYVQLQSMFDAGFPDGRKYYQKSGLVSTLTPKTIDTLIQVFEVKRAHPLTMQLQGMGGAAHRVKPDATAFVHRESLTCRRRLRLTAGQRNFAGEDDHASHAAPLTWLDFFWV